MPIVLTWSIGTALSSARRVWATVTQPGARLRQTSAAFGPRLVEVGESVEPGAVAVGPRGLERVAADDLHALQNEALRRVGDLRADDVAEHIRLAAARRARARAAEQIERDVGLRAVAPRDGEFGADGLDRGGSEPGGHGEVFSSQCSVVSQHKSPLHSVANPTARHGTN